jgi:hypothetical protein
MAMIGGSNALLRKLLELLIGTFGPFSIIWRSEASRNAPQTASKLKD